MKQKVALVVGLATAAVLGSVALTVLHETAATAPADPAGFVALPRSGGAAAGPVADPVPPALSIAHASRAAAALVNARPKLFFTGADDKLVSRQVVRQDGLAYVAYERTYKALPVRGGDAVVVTDPNGTVLSSYSAQHRVLSVGTKARVSPQAAVRVARAQLVRVDAAGLATLTVVAAGSGVLAYEVVVSGAKRVAAGVVPSHLHVFVDAGTGAVLRDLTRDDVVDAVGHGSYYGDVTVGSQGSGGRFTLADPTRPGLQCGGQNGNAFTGAADSWGNGGATDQVTGCVDAMYAVSQEWNMLRDWLGRNGIDGNGHAFPIRLGLNDVNAFWNGDHAEFGHTADDRRLLTVMDVVGHEFGHAINQFTPGGSSGGNEAGGMNESTGDIFGALTEFYANNPRDPGDYEVGELANLTGGGPIRYMFDPSKAGDPNCYSSRIPSTEVHSAAGPQNHWFYLVAEGSRPTDGQPVSPTCNNTAVTGIGIQKAGRIYLATLMRKTSGWSYAKARAASVAAAAQLFGNGAECATVKAAWDAVSVAAAGGEPACSSGPTPGPSRTTNPSPTVGPTVTAGPGRPTSPAPTASPSGTRRPTPTANPTPTGQPTPTAGPTGDCQGGYAVHDGGTLGAGQAAYTAAFSAAAGRQSGCLSGPDTADFDLYLEKRVAGGWRTVARSVGPDAHELIRYDGTTGTYRYRVAAYAGTGPAVLGWNTPGGK